MTTAPRIVYLHIGLHKTGTTYLQNLFRANRDNLRGAGVEFPGDPRLLRQTDAVFDLQGRRPRGYNDPRVHGQWGKLVEAVNTCRQPRALISEERLSLSTLRQAQKAVGAFAQSEVHVIVTTRDLARVLVSQWQENIKSGGTTTWRQFADSVSDPAGLAVNPARSFWARQDLAKVCDVWGAVVPADRVHVVTVPRSGTSPDLLTERFASVVGFAADVLTEDPVWTNETIGVAATEVIRRVNQRLDGRLNQRQHDRVVNATIARMFVEKREAVRFGLPEAEIGWVAARADAMIADVVGRGYDVVGDIEELRAQYRPGLRRPDEAGESELLEAALDALALVTEKHALTWWSRHKHVIEAEAQPASWRSRARAAVFRTQRRAAELADNNKVAAKGMSAVLRARDRSLAKRRTHKKA